MDAEKVLTLHYRRAETGSLRLIAIDGKPVELSREDLAALHRLKAAGEWDRVRSVILDGPEAS